MKYLASASVLAFTITSHASAQEPFRLGTLFFSVSNTPILASRTGAIVSVIEGDRLIGADTSLAQTLDRQAGVSFSTNGGLGSYATVRIRGLDNRYVAVRVDGIDVSDPSSSQNAFNFAGLTYGGLGRVELLKGSQSAIYGSEAIGGVVDISSARPIELGFSGSASFEAGSFGTLSSALTLAQKGERGEVTLAYSHTKTDGISARASNTEEDGYNENRISLTGRYILTDAVTLGGALLWRDSDAEYDLSVTNTAGELASTQKGGRFFAEIQTGAVQNTLAFSAFENSRKDPLGYTTSFEGDRRQFEYRGSADLGATRLNFGLDSTKESFTLPSAAGEQTTNAVFAEAMYAWNEALDISLALRHDEHSEFGGKTTGRLAAAWRPSEETIIRAVVGSGFRAPSLYELYGPYGLATLVPENSRSAELSIEKAYGDLASVKATLFYTEIDDKIGYAGATYNQVSGMTRSEGFELEGNWQATDRINVYGGYTYTNARTNGARDVRIPLHDLTVGVQAKVNDRLSAGLELSRVADVVPSIYAPVNHKVGDYTLVNFTATYGLSKTTEAYLRVENLTDEDYETAGGFNQPGRAAYFGVRTSF